MRWEENYCRCRVWDRIKVAGAGWHRVATWLFAALLGLPAIGSAYVGPGAGLSMIGSALALLAVILVAMAGLIIWPVRALQRRKKGKMKKTP